jgi:hypothetical protein
MKTSTPTLIAGIALFALALNLHSQGILPRTPIDQLKALKAKNAELIETQKATLQKLDELDKAAEQMRFFSKRS